MIGGRVRYLLVLLVICLIGCELPVDQVLELAELEVVNDLAYSIGCFYTWDTRIGGWSGNLVEGKAILPGESRIFELTPSLYQLKAVTIRDIYYHTADIPLEGYHWIVVEW